MSIQAVSWVLDHSESGGSDRLAMISLANHAGADRIAGPSMQTIASEAHLSRDTVRRCLTHLADLGEIEEVDESDAPKWWRALPVNHRPKLWRLHLGVAPCYPKSGADDDDVGGLGVAQGLHRGGTAMPPEPYNEVTRERDNQLPNADASGLEDETKQRNIEAKSILDAFWTHVREKTGHSPPEDPKGVLGIIRAALKDGFTRLEIKNGLLEIHKNRPRPITKQTLWDAMKRSNTNTTGWPAHDEVDAAWFREHYGLGQ